MSIITIKGLEKYVGQRVGITREGIRSNVKHPNGVIKPGFLAGILQSDARGFYVKMFATYWTSEKLVYDDKHFFDQVYRVQEGDQISMNDKRRVSRYIFEARR